MSKTANYMRLTKFHC